MKPARERLRLIAAISVTVAIVAPLGWMWQRSLLPDEYSVMDMGYMDYGGGPKPEGAGHHDAAPRRSVDDLITRSTRPADVKVNLVARQGKVKLASGRVVDGYSLNGTTPGPQIRAVEGQLIEVRIRNESVPDGITLHWHGIDVPNSQDGVAGVTQDAVPVGKSHTYRFVAKQVGTYWYHSHQVSHKQVIGGLFAPLVVTPKAGIEQDKDVLGVSHTYSGTRTLNGREGTTRINAEPGDRVRVRIVNTDNGTMSTWSSGPYRVIAIDGNDLNGPTAVSGRRLEIPAGGRADLQVTVPQAGTVRVNLGAATAFVLGPKSERAEGRVPQPTKELDLRTYGKPETIPFDVATANRRFTFVIGRRFGFLDGKPGLWWTVNGRMYPNIPMYVVSFGDVVTFRIINNTSEVHPMHLHGHHATVIARNGKPWTGSPVWYDSLDVKPDETVDIAFRATNPGVWMDHCHNLPHARDGMIAHLMYEGVDTPYKIGGRPDNEPE